MTRAVERAKTLAEPRLVLADEFQLVIDDRSIAVPHSVQRLLALLAIGRRPIARSKAAGLLWLDVPEWRALGNLRTALWRLGRIPWRVVHTIDERIALDPSLSVDITEVAQLATRILVEPESIAADQLPRLLEATDILPGWEEEWLIVERERFRELRLHALERVCDVLTKRGMTGSAAMACLAAIESEPFRESAQRLLVQLHLVEGNRAAALRSYIAYRNLVESELGIEPSDLMRDMVAGLEGDRTR
jgi:DNA-binding SARP family transcriptional activator